MRQDPYLKAEMTVKHVVTFTAGFPNPPDGEMATSEGVTIAAICTCLRDVRSFAEVRSLAGCL